MKDKRTTTVHVNVIVINITSIVAFFSAVRIIFFRSMVNISRSRRRRKMRINTMRKECWKIAGDCGPGPEGIFAVKGIKSTAMAPGMPY